MNFVSEYIKYLLKAKGRHGIHSPFVYDFADKCLTKLPDENFRAGIKRLKKALKAGKQVIHTVDAGAGSKTLGSARTVRSIYKTAAAKGVYADLLYQLTSYYKPRRVLELGTSLGVGTIHLAAGSADTNVISLDACKKTLDQAAQNIESMNIKNIQLIHSTFKEYLQKPPSGTFDLVYIDGHHEGEALKQYMQLLQPHTHADTIFLLDDIRWSKDMFDAWNTLAGSGEYHLSLDLFRMGMLIRRPSQQKEHFIIRLKNVAGGF